MQVLNGTHYCKQYNGIKNHRNSTMDKNKARNLFSVNTNNPRNNNKTRRNHFLGKNKNRNHFLDNWGEQKKNRL